MVTVTRRTMRRDGVTYAHVVLENERAERRRVRLEVLVDDAVWPPRRRGVPAPGWDEDGVTVTVAAGGARGIGFATPGSIPEEFVSVDAIDRPGGGAEGTAANGSPNRSGNGSAKTSLNGSTNRSANGSANELGNPDGDEANAPSSTDVVRALGSFAPPLAATPREASTERDAAREPRGSDSGTGTASEHSGERDRSLQRDATVDQ